MSERPDPVREGIDAYAQGVASERYPHREDSEDAQLWLTGWDDAKRIHDDLIEGNE